MPRVRLDVNIHQLAILSKLNLPSLREEAKIFPYQRWPTHDQRVRAGVQNKNFWLCPRIVPDSKT
jgi:hypothetical protein